MAYANYTVIIGIFRNLMEMRPTVLTKNSQTNTSKSSPRKKKYLVLLKRVRDKADSQVMDM